MSNWLTDNRSEHKDTDQVAHDREQISAKNQKQIQQIRIQFLFDQQQKNVVLQFLQQY